MKKKKVEPLFGVFPTSCDIPKDVIELLEYYLKRAKKGEIAGIAVAFVDGAGSVCSNHAPGCADKNLMMAAVHSLHTDVTRVWYDSFHDIEARDQR